MDRVPTSWYEGEHLLARLKLHNVPESDPAWCVATDHAWGPYTPEHEPMPAPMLKPEPVSAEYVPMKAYRDCLRCDARQDYKTGEIRFGAEIQRLRKEGE